MKKVALASIIKTILCQFHLEYKGRKYILKFNGIYWLVNGVKIEEVFLLTKAHPITTEIKIHKVATIKRAKEILTFYLNQTQKSE